MTQNKVGQSKPTEKTNPLQTNNLRKTMKVETSFGTIQENMSEEGFNSSVVLPFQPLK